MPRWDAQAEERLRTAAIELFLQLGYENVTVSQIAEPEQLAAAHLYLMQNEYVTGTVHTVDGGLLLAGS